MTYFNSFRQNLYEFTIGGKTQTLTVLDITKNVRFVKQFIDAIPSNNTYRLLDGERLDIIAEKLYGNPHYDVFLMLLNGIYDIHSDLPIPSSEFDNYMKQMYGDKQFDTLHYEDDDGYKYDAEIIVHLSDNDDPVVAGITTFDKLKVGDVIVRETANDTYRAIVKKIQGNKVFCTIPTGNLKIGDSVDIMRYSNNTQTVIDESNKILNVSILNNANPISFYEYEYLKNEQKRIIKIIPKEQIGKVVSEFERLMNE